MLRTEAPAIRASRRTTATPRDLTPPRQASTLLDIDVVVIALDRLALRPLAAACILEPAIQSLFFRCARDPWLIGRLECSCLGADVLDLGIAIGVISSALGLAVDVTPLLPLP